MRTSKTFPKLLAITLVTILIVTSTPQLTIATDPLLTLPINLIKTNSSDIENADLPFNDVVTPQANSVYNNFITSPDQDPLPVDAIHIQTTTQLATLGGPQSADKYYVLDNDLTLIDKWIPLDDFKGTLDGRGHSINNFYISPNNNQPSAGLFGHLSATTIKNIGLNIASTGLLAATPDTPSSLVYIGSLIGYITGTENVTVENCYVIGNISIPDISTQAYTGGFIGSSTGNVSMKNCYIRGNIAASATDLIYAGGLIGSAIGGATIENCYIQGNVCVSAADYLWATAGGLIGSGNNLNVKNCYVRGEISTSALTSAPSWLISGGLTGGIAGSANGIVMENCYVIANISAFSMSDSSWAIVGGLTGGLVGSDDGLVAKNCYVVAELSALSMFSVGIAGRLVGCLTESIFESIFENIFETGDLLTLSIKSHSCYYLSTQTLTGNTLNFQGTSLTPTQMSQQSSFIGWDFDTIWILDPNVNEGYPHLGVFSNSEIEIEHIWTIKAVIDPTCEAQGYTIYECAKCGTTKKDTYLPATGHTIGEGIVTTIATCETEGELTYFCLLCSTKIRAETISITEHLFDKGVYSVPLCAVDGYWTFTCFVCNHIYIEADEGSALAHNYVGVITTPATCVDEGLLTYTCSTCDNSFTESIAPSHNYVATITPPLSCENIGYTTYICTVCSDSYVVVDYYANIEHQWVHEIIVPATCETEGVAINYCNVCSKGSDIFIVIPVLDHVWSVFVVVPTCTEPGYSLYVCVNDDVHSYVDDFVDALGHDWAKYVITTQATCEKEGVMVFSCLHCGATYTKPIEKLVHNYVDVIIVPTCTSQGYTTHICSICGDSYLDDFEDTLAHVWQIKQIVSPTCTEQGYTIYACLGCGVTQQTHYVPASGHVEGRGVVTKEPACENGVLSFFCTKCNTLIRTQILLALGHIWDTGIVTTPATSKTLGVMTYTCRVCGETHNETIAKLPSTNILQVNGIEIEYELINGMAVLRPTQAQMSTILGGFGTVVVFDLRGQTLVELYVGADWFKNVDKTLTIKTDAGEASVKTKTLWNNSGKTRLITVSDGKLDFKNI
ncbi:MAG: hypothetical protein LBQ98_05645 [Nitrososphaerota archaeon]|nr:hypothetical protein [Nitrososphaerota archaeon]